MHGLHSAKHKHDYFNNYNKYITKIKISTSLQLLQYSYSTTSSTTMVRLHHPYLTLSSP